MSKKAKLPDIFKDAVAKDDTRFALSKPWYVKPYWYATDGRICVRWCGPRTAGEHRDLPFPDASQLSWNDEYEDEPIELPTGIESELCELCDGLGETTCPGCETEISCSACDGTGQEDVVVRIAEREHGDGAVTYVNLPLRRVEMLVKHGAVVYLHKSKPLHSLRFTIEEQGVEGLIMPTVP